MKTLPSVGITRLIIAILIFEFLFGVFWAWEAITWDPPPLWVQLFFAGGLAGWWIKDAGSEGVRRFLFDLPFPFCGISGEAKGFFYIFGVSFVMVCVFLAMSELLIGEGGEYFFLTMPPLIVALSFWFCDVKRQQRL